MPSETTIKPETLRGRRGRRDSRENFRQRFHSPAYVEAVTTAKPQVLFKIVSQARGYRAKAVMEYISRTTNQQPEQAADPGLNQDGGRGMQFEDANGQSCQGQAAIDKKYNEWKKDFERAIPGSKRPPRHVAHMILSAALRTPPKMRVRYWPQHGR